MKNSSFNIENYLHNVCNISNKSKLFNEIYEKFKEFENSGFDKFQVANGHDTLEIIGVLLVRNIGNNRTKIAQEIDAEVRMCFECNFFNQTMLIQELIKWQQKENLILFKK